jgi:hypothetical protein
MRSRLLLALGCKLILHNLHSASLLVLQIPFDYHAVNMACTILACYRYFIAEAEYVLFPLNVLYVITCGVNALLLETGKTGFNNTRVNAQQIL